MKIAITVPSLANKAPVLVAKELAIGYLEAGAEVFVFYFDSIVEVDFPCPTEKIGRTDFSKLRGFDIIHSHMLRPDGFSWACRNIAFIPGKYVTTIHNIVEEDLLYSYGKSVSAIFSRLWRALWNGLDGRVVLTKQALSYYKSTQPKTTFEQIYNGRSKHVCAPLDAADSVRIAEARAGGRRVIGACAVVSRRKGLEQVIEALPSLPDHSFVLVGEGPALQQLRELAANLGVADRFIPLGYRSNARDFLSEFDIYAMPSRSEGLPLALLEAVSAGVPAVCSDIQQFREVFSPIEVSYFHLDDKHALVAAVLAAEKRKTEQRTAALRRFEMEYTQSAMANRYMEFFRSLRGVH